MPARAIPKRSPAEFSQMFVQSVPWIQSVESAMGSWSRIRGLHNGSRLLCGRFSGHQVLTVVNSPKQVEVIL
jgi:hypothetical protein